MSKITGLNEFQKSFVLWGVNKARCLLRASAGSGKSLAAVSLHRLWSQKIPNFGKLVIITKTKAVNVFDSALQLFHFSTVKLIDSSDASLFYSSYEFPSDCYIISSTLITKLMSETSTIKHRQGLFKLLCKTSTLVIEESHNYRNYSAKMTQSLVKLTDYYNKFINADSLHHRLIALTATPLYKDLTNWFGVFRFLDPSLFGVYYRDFESTYCIVEERTSNGYGKAWTRNGSHSVRKTNSFKVITGFKNVDNLNAKIQPYIFEFNATEFSFKYSLIYYSFSPEELQSYNTIIDGTGLDKQFAITIEHLKSQLVLYRDSSDSFFTDSQCSLSITVKESYAGLVIWYESAFWKITNIESNRTHGNYSLRCVKAIEAEGVVQDRLVKIADLIQSYSPDGVLINFAYHNTIDQTESYLHQRFPGRRIIKLTGKTSSFNSVFQSINWASDIVLITRVANESLSMYAKHLIISECPTNPGSFIQLIGRLTRHDNPHKNISVDLLLNSQSGISTYFYARLLYLVKTGKLNSPAVSYSLMPKPQALASVPEDRITISYLKRKFLWQKIKLADPKSLGK